MQPDCVCNLERVSTGTCRVEVSMAPAKKSATNPKKLEVKLTRKAPQAEPGKKKFKKKPKYNMHVFIHRVLKQVHPDIRISKIAMSIMGSLVMDIFERVATEASNLTKNSKKPILQTREIQTAVRLLLPGELAKHAISEGTKAVAKYYGTV